MRLLLTRAAQDVARTRTKLEATGHSVVASPIIAIEPIDAAWPESVVDAVLATSGHAFAAIAATPFPIPEARRLMPLFLVGARTQETARSCGFLGRALVEPSATTLAAHVAEFVPAARRLVYLAGRDRKPEIETVLAANGQAVEVVETYQATPAPALTHAAREGFRAGTIDGVLHFSRRSALLFVTLARQDGATADSVRHFCLSEDVAGPLRDAGFAEIACAEMPNEDALLAMLSGADYA